MDVAVAYLPPGASVEFVDEHTLVPPDCPSSNARRVMAKQVVARTMIDGWPVKYIRRSKKFLHRLLLIKCSDIIYYIPVIQQLKAMMLLLFVPVSVCG